MVLPIANTLIKTLFTQSLSRIYPGPFCCTKHAFKKPNDISSSGPEEIKTPPTKPQACLITKRRAHLSYSQTPTQNASIRNQTQENYVVKPDYRHTCQAIVISPLSTMQEQSTSNKVANKPNYHMSQALRLVSTLPKEQ